MSILSDVKSIGPDEALRLEASAKAGDLQAAIRFTRYAIWRKLTHDREIPADLKPTLFKALAKTIDVKAEVARSGG